MRENKVTIITNNFQPHYSINLTNGLIENGVRVDYLGSARYDFSKINSTVNFINIRGFYVENASKIEKVKKNLKYYWRLVGYTLKANNKVFHILWLKYNFIEGVIINLLFKCLGRKIVYTAHNVLPHTGDNLVNRVVFFLIYHIVDVIIVHTDFMKKRIVNEFNVRENRIKVVKHGVYDVQANPLLTKEKARRKLGLKTNDKVILLFGRITRYKGLNVLMPAFNNCVKDLNGLKLIIAGVVDKDFKYELKQILQYRKVRNSIITKFGGYIPDEEVEILFKASNVVVLPYLEASQSGVLFLSYAYGRYVIAPNIGAFPADIVIGKTGYIFEAGNCEDLANKIKLYFDNLWQRETELENPIKQYANSEYSWEKIGANLARIYLTVAN